MKQIGLGFILLASICGAITGCNSVATDNPGVFVANVEGTYDLAVVTQSNICIEVFDTAVSVTQTQDRFTILAETNGFSDLAGVFNGDSEVVYTLTGAGTTCDGSFGEGLLVNVCTVSVKVETADGTLSDEEFSCQVTYQRQ